MKISIGSDHGGFNLKEKIKARFNNEYEFIDRGTYSKDSCDYPVYAKAVGEDVRDKNVDYGIVICTNGVGVTIVANKVKGVRAALCLNNSMAEHAKLHNDANVIALGAENQSDEEAFEMVKIFIETPFSFEERHVRRVNEIKNMEEK